MVKPKHKQPGFGAKVEALKKEARLGADPDAAERLRPAWRVGSVDWGGPYGWGALSEPARIKELCDRLRSFESMSWVEIESSGSHNIAVEDICKAARDRLQELNQDDVDELFSLRVTGERRVLGFREANILRLLWWDPNHEVCPSVKKHT